MKAKDQKSYWKDRIAKREYDHDGETRETSEYYARMQWAGKRKWVSLGTSNKDIAAAAAAAKYILLTTGGWEALAKKSESLADEITLGAFLTRVHAVSRVSSRTWGLYAKSLRQIAGELKKWDSPSGPSFTWEAHRTWKEKVDGLKLSLLSPLSIGKWMKRYVDERGTNPEAKRRAKNSCNTTLRNAKALFTDDLLKAASLEKLENPFHGLKAFSSERTRYKSAFDAEALIAAAEEELTAPKAEEESKDAYNRRMEAFKALILFGFTAIRRKEADLLLWEQVDLANGTIDIRRTRYFEPKAESSIGKIHLSDAAVALLRGFRARDPKDEFVLKGFRPRPDRTYSCYRSEKTFLRLIEWLRSYTDEEGNQPLADTQKPLHTIRKEIGAMIASRVGIFAAQRFLRHAEIATTERYYSDQKAIVTAGIREAI
jgi:integrase